MKYRHPYYKYDTKPSLRFNRCKVIDTEKKELHNKATRTMRESCDAAASAQTAQRCSDVLRIPEDSGTEDSRAEAPATTIVWRKERARVGKNFFVN
jgi:hypothetical protein